MGANEFAAVEAIRDAVPTSRHAQMLFDMVGSRLGDLAVVETCGGATRLDLYRREAPDSDAIVPWPLLRIGTQGRLSTIVPIAGSPDASSGLPPRSGRAPKLRNLGPGELVVLDGPHTITITYGDDGRWFETSRSERADAHAAVIPALAKSTAQSTELLAAYVASLNPARHGSGRVLRPVPIPGGVASAWNVGLLAARAALFDGQIPSDAPWIVIDGFAGRALVWGTTRSEALAAWRRMVAHEQPRPDLPDASEPPEPEGHSVKPLDAPEGAIGFEVRITGPAPDVSWPAFVPENTPAVVIAVERCPHDPRPPWQWTRLLGRHGQTVHVLVQHRPEGCLLVGEDLALSDVVDLDTIETSMDIADAAWQSPGLDRPELKSKLIQYQFVDEQTGDPITPRNAGGRRSAFFDIRGLDGEVLRWQAFRQSWT